MKGFKRVIISRTDSIGDVILSLPVAGMMKKIFPETEIAFLGRSYTRDVIDACGNIDSFVNWDDINALNDDEAVRAFKNLEADAIIHVFPRRRIAKLARKARIPFRMGTTNRIYHWTNCNKLIRLSRRNSDLHEAQLNLKLIASLTEIEILPKEEIKKLYGLSKVAPPDPQFIALTDPKKFNLILHPKSKGSAREWGIDNFIKLCGMLPPEKYRIFVSGTDEEGRMINDSGIFEHRHVTDITGKMTLSAFMSFIRHCDGLVAASTGPLHLAAALGTIAIGIYPPIRPMHPGRWAPIGDKATFLVKDKECQKCRKQGPCDCMSEISPEEVKETLIRMS